MERLQIMLKTYHLQGGSADNLLFSQKIYDFPLIYEVNAKILTRLPIFY